SERQPEERVRIGRERSHSKASERYVDAQFEYGGETWHVSIPIEYRRTGVDLTDPTMIREYVDNVYEACHPDSRTEWLEEQRRFWDSKPGAVVTRPFFEALCNFQWTCVECGLPRNRNWARRFQDLKEFGYTLATDTG